MTRATFRLAAIASAFVVGGAAAATAQSAADFYKGKSVEIYIGYGVGGTYGKSATALAHHLKPRIGADSVVVKSMPGSGGLKMTNYYANVAPKTGLAIILPPDTLVVTQLLKPNAAKYKATNFTWLGAIVRANSLAAVRTDSGVNSWKDMTTKAVNFGSSGVGSQTFQLPALYNGLLGTKIKIIKGYKGSRKMLLAVEQGEVAGVNLTALAWVTDRKAWFDKKFVTPVIQMGPSPSPHFPNVPRFRNLVKADDRPIVDFMTSLVTIGRSFAVPKETPKDRIEFLSKAIADVANDPKFVADMKKSKLSVTYSSGPSIQKVIAETLKTPPAVIKRVQDLFDQAS